MSAPESWKTAYRELIETITRMGYPEEFGRAIAKNLGSEKAMRRMTAYLYSAKPRSAEDIEDARFIADEASDNELEHIQKTMTESNDLKIVARMKAIQSLSNINIKNQY